MKHKFNKDLLHKGVQFSKDESLTDQEIVNRLSELKKRNPDADLEAEKKKLLEFNKVVK